MDSVGSKLERRIYTSCKPRSRQIHSSLFLWHTELALLHNTKNPLKWRGRALCSFHCLVHYQHNWAGGLLPMCVDLWGWAYHHIILYHEKLKFSENNLDPQKMRSASAELEEWWRYIAFSAENFLRVRLLRFRLGHKQKETTTTKTLVTVYAGNYRFCFRGSHDENQGLGQMLCTSNKWNGAKDTLIFQCFDKHQIWIDFVVHR